MPNEDNPKRRDDISKFSVHLTRDYEGKKPADNLIEQIKKIEGFVNFVLKNKTYSILFVFYTVSYLILLYLIIISIQEIINSKLINMIITFYFKDKLIMLTTLMGLIGAFTILIGYISSENEERIIGKEGKLLLGLTFWHKNFLTKIGILILIIVFTKTYYGTFNYQELIILLLLLILLNLVGKHFKDHIIDIYDWNTLENNEYKIYVDISLGISAFEVGFFLYIYSLQFVRTLVFNIVNFWIFFLSIILLALFKYPRTKRVIVKYTNNKKEYAYLVRIEDGFARIITNKCKSKQINLNEINEINYDIKHIENFRRFEKKE
jgi:hypothetical protein